MSRVTLPWIAASILAASMLAGSIGAQDAVSFERDVLPFLQAKCFKCHGEPKRRNDGTLEEPKGGLRLDGRGWFERGGDGEDAVVAGDLAESGVYRRVTLPDDDPDFMPSKGTPLTDTERATLRRWIERGADFGDWTGVRGPDATVPTEVAPVVVARRTAILQRLGEGLRPVDAAAIRKIAAGSAQIVPVFPGSPLLRVSFRAAESDTGDERIAELAPLREHIAELVLARSEITDHSLATVAHMPRLVRLDLSQTDVSDAGVQKLRKLTELRALNLFATAVSDRVADTLTAMESLEQVWLWQTGVSARARAQLVADKPALRVVGAPEWPDSAVPSDGEPARRRRK